MLINVVLFKNRVSTFRNGKYPQAGIFVSALCLTKQKAGRCCLLQDVQLKAEFNVI
jgi:hypothetical protein